MKNFSSLLILVDVTIKLILQRQNILILGIINTLSEDIL
jgi:hypothetical protein